MQANSHYITDSVRGVADSGLLPDSDAANDGSVRITSIDSDGFTTAGTLYSYVNTSGTNYMAYNWKGSEGSPVSNTDGTITTSVIANPTAGFGMLEYTSTGSNATLGHGLSQAPNLVYIKGNNIATNWVCSATPLGFSKFWKMNVTDVPSSNSGMFQDTAPSSSVITIGTDGSVNSASGKTYVAYYWHQIDGYCSIGSL